MKRAREMSPSEPEEANVLTLIADAEFEDLALSVIHHALLSLDHDVLEGVWMLCKASRFWHKHDLLQRLLPLTLFQRMDKELERIKAAYQRWPVRGPFPGPPRHIHFPWVYTDYRYHGSSDDRPFKPSIYRPMFIAWARWHFPTPLSLEEQEELNAMTRHEECPCHEAGAERYICWCSQISWCVAALNGGRIKEHGILESDFPELDMRKYHVLPIVARLMQLSTRLANDVIIPVHCLLDHNESLPFLLYYLAACTMKNPHSTEHYNRNFFEEEVADTAWINKILARKRKMADRYARILMPTPYLHEGQITGWN